MNIFLALRVLKWSLGNRVPLEGARRLPRVDPLSGSGRDSRAKDNGLCLENIRKRKYFPIEIKINENNYWVL